MNISRRDFLTGLTGATAAAVSFPFYAYYVEPRWLSIYRARVPFFSQPPGRPVRLLHLSDFHVSDVVPISFVEEAIRLGIAQAPDLAVITGDFITRHMPDMNAYARALRGLSNVVPVFAILGNHDGGYWIAQRGGPTDTQQVRQLLTDSGITLLHNSSAKVSVAGQEFNVIGMGDIWAREFHAQTAFSSIPADDLLPRVVLSHNPDSKSELETYSWQLLLSGHTHGGQVFIPFLGAPLAPVKDHRYVAGLRRWRDRWIAVTRGVGNLHGIRFNCRPEVGLLELGGPAHADKDDVAALCERRKHHA